MRRARRFLGAAGAAIILGGAAARAATPAPAAPAPASASRGTTPARPAAAFSAPALAAPAHAAPPAAALPVHAVPAAALPVHAVPAPAAPAPASLLAGPPAPAAPKPWALTVRGGVSLGSYEAGLSWAYLRLLRARPGAERDHNLRVITGASAGNINAFIAAINWCQSDAAAAAETAGNNPFWSAWIPIGFEQLFPGPNGNYRPDDGLFTRKAFDGMEARVKSMLVDPDRYDNRCVDKPLSLGVTVTRARPDTVCLGEDGHDSCSATGRSIPIRTQRFVLAFNVQVKSDAGLKPRLVFTLPPRLDRSVGSELRLLTGEGGVVSANDLIAVMEASSAFPIAFGPRRIDYCRDDRTNDGKAGCQANSDKFFDGGVFDNIPLGLAVNLAVRDQCAGAVNPKECTRLEIPALDFLYIDPGHLRAHRESTTDEEVEDESDRRGLGNVKDFLGNFVDVSTQYELQSVDRYVFQHGGGMPLPRLTSHFHPIVGNYLGHFGAFLARPFREYDYYVGLYDAVWGTASGICTTKADADKAAGKAPNQLTIAACLIDEVVRAYDGLKLNDPGNEVASFMVKRLFTDELEAFVGDPAGSRALLQHVISGPDGVALAGGTTAAEWLAAARALRMVTPAGGDEIALMDALVTTQLGIAAAQARADALGPRIAERLAPPATFSDFVEKLADTMKARSIRVQAFFSADEQALLRDPNRWLSRKGTDAIERLNDIEVEDDYGLGKDLTVLGQLIANSEPVRAPGFLELDPSSVPDTFTWLRLTTHFLPYWIAGDVYHGGYEIGWRPTLWPLSRLGLSFPFTPFVWVRGTDAITGAIGAGLVLRFNNPAVTGIELVPARLAYTYSDTNHLFGDQGHSFGGEAAVYLAAGKLRVSGTLVNYGQIKNGNAWSVYIGLADVNGLVYWAIRLLKG